MAALRLTCPSAVQHDKTGFRRGPGEFKEILAVACDHNGTGEHGMMPDVHVIGSHAEHFRYQRNFVPRLAEAASYFHRDIFIHQESHSSR